MFNIINYLQTYLPTFHGYRIHFQVKYVSKISKIENVLFQNVTDLLILLTDTLNALQASTRSPLSATWSQCYKNFSPISCGTVRLFDSNSIFILTL
jgi:hypothetical protein